MSNIFILIFLLSLISKKILSLYIEECSDKLDCFNCTITPGCQWENKSCINQTENEYNHTLLDTDNSTILYQDLKCIRNRCIENKAPYLPEENYLYDDLSDKYCGNKLTILTEGNIKNGFRIELKNNSDIYGTPNILCEYILTHGRIRIDADIFINRSLSHDFLLFYSNDLKQSVQINYSCTLTIFGMERDSVSFFYYSNKSFETSPFIIYFQKDEIIEEDSQVLAYLFLVAIIGFVVLSIVGIIVMRKCSLFFKLNRKRNNEFNNNDININVNMNENKGDLSIISEKNIEENSRNENEVDLQELKTIKENKIESDKNNKDDNNNKNNQ